VLSWWNTYTRVLQLSRHRWAMAWHPDERARLVQIQAGVRRAGSDSAPTRAVFLGKQRTRLPRNAVWRPSVSTCLSPMPPPELAHAGVTDWQPRPHPSPRPPSLPPPIPSAPFYVHGPLAAIPGLCLLSPPRLDVGANWQGTGVPTCIRSRNEAFHSATRRAARVGLPRRQRQLPIARRARAGPALESRWSTENTADGLAADWPGPQDGQPT